MTRSNKIVVYWDYSNKANRIKVLLCDKDKFNSMNFNEQCDFIDKEMKQEPDCVAYSNKLVYTDNENKKCELYRKFSSFNNREIGKNMLQGDISFLSPFKINRVDVSLSCFA